jgi:hypothetical protein
VGDTILDHNPEGRYSVRLFRLSSGELVVVYLRNHRVGLIKFVEAIYGIAEWQDEAYSSYPSQGIAFNRSGERVHHIEVFEKRPALGPPGEIR